MKTDKSMKDLAIEAANNREYAKKYYEAHKAEAHKRYLKNREAIKARTALWRLQNRARYLAQQADYDKNRRLKGNKQDVDSHVDRMSEDARSSIKW